MQSDRKHISDSWPATPDAVRREIEQRLGRPIPDSTWEGLERLELVSEALIDPNSLDELEDYARRFTNGSAQRRASGRESRRDLPPDERLKVLEQMTAQQAASNWMGHVADFRNEHLGGGTLKPEQALDWLDARAAEEGPSTTWGTLPINPGTGEPLPNPTAIWSMDFHSLWYWADASPEALGMDAAAFAQLTNVRGNIHIGERYPHLDNVSIVHGQIWAVVRTAQGGVLDTLFGWSQLLAEWYRWEAGEATAFILTGAVPMIPRMRIRRLHMHTRPPQWRIVLDIHPTVSPREVLLVYRQQRQAALVGTQRRKQRPLDVLYRFRQERIDLPWRDVFDQWNAANAENKGLQYSQITNMQRDYRRAVDLGTGSMPYALPGDDQW
ncbi:MAG TPA: hypothetical protein VKT78_12980 [Fimbriimonadaceae bacterium]|nr:hypothetical protein [Fimbriimonadaceae bacterium]